MDLEAERIQAKCAGCLVSDAVLDYCIHWGEDSQVSVDRADQLTDAGEAGGEPCGADDAAGPAEHYGAWGADGVGESSG
jgi:hypothetical protein